MATDRIAVHPREEIGRIVPDVYGHFAEHLGRCIYDGLWVGEDADVEHVDGLRAETVRLLRDLNPPVLRWPGGCFADDYHWEDGVGPREERPRRRNLWWTQGPENVPEEPNTFGTHEFVRLCREIGADPYIALNVGTGDADEATDWIEYCNYDGDTELAAWRAENGREEPFGVPYWGVGNENWGCGGRYDPDVYAREYRRFANYLRSTERLMLDEGLELIACGHVTPDWNREFMAALEDYSLLDHLSVHRYIECGDAVEFADGEHYRLLAQVGLIADDVDEAAEIVDHFAPPGSVGVIVDEWGVWHPEAEADNGLEQPNTVRDALVAAGALDAFNERADVVTMANLAQTVNVLQCVVQTDAGDAWPTPTYRVFDLYRPHMGATAVRAHVETDVREVAEEDHDLPLVSASASRDDGGLYVTASNRHLDDAREVRIEAGGVADAEAEVLFADRGAREHSTADNAGDFAAADHPVDIEGDAIVVELPPTSVVGVSID